MKKALLLLTIIFCISGNVSSSHILGGDVSIQQIGANSYKVNLRFFRYCTGAGSPTSITNAKIYRSSNDSLFTTISLAKDSNYAINFSCLSNSLCTEFHSYSGIITLPNDLAGYYFVWGSCCNVAPINITNSNYSLFTATFPGPNIPGGNTTPIFKRNYSDHYICVNSLRKIDYSCSDPNGDSLVYSLITPYNGVTPKPFSLALWNLGYGLTNIINGTCTIDSVGIVSLNAYALGNYIVAVKCEEYRNGIKIGEVVRELELTAINCSSNNITIKDTVCGSFNSPSGKTFTTSGIYIDSLISITGCDSIVTYDLTIRYIDTSTTFWNPVIESNDTSAQYQWLDCNNSYAPIFGATNRSYSILGNGSYAVQVSNNGCIDTSTCFRINNLSIDDIDLKYKIKIFPNPTNGAFTINLGKQIGLNRIYITDINGRLIKEIIPKNIAQYEISFEGASGIYLLNIAGENESITMKIIKE